MKYGLLGEKLGHSFSTMIHREFNNPEYILKEVAREDIHSFMEAKDFLGLNVTIPYKETVMEHCKLDNTVSVIGAVNTIVNRDGILYGFNTDWLGFLYMTKKAGISYKDKNVFIFGNGGTAKTASYACAREGAKSITICSRRDIDVTPFVNIVKAVNPECEIVGTNYNEDKSYVDAQIIVNTTPMGMYPNNYSAVIDIDECNALEGVVDVVYNPLTTELVARAKSKGIPATCGLPMLVAQAYFAEEIFMKPEITSTDDFDFDALMALDSDGNVSKTVELNNKVTDLIFEEMSNIVLIGMPGVGKTTCANSMKEKLSREVVDSDDEFTLKYGIKPGEYISTFGEKDFRDKETEVIKEISKRTGIIIATGGGAILREENRRALHQNGVVVHLHSGYKTLATEGRPLSQGKEELKALYYKRLPIYMECADIINTITSTDVDAEVNKAIERIKNYIFKKADNKMKVLVMNGPNINMLGIREPNIYGRQTYDDLLKLCKEEAAKRDIEVSFFQSNSEGELVTAIQDAYGVIDGIIINPAAYTHTSVALLDALKAVGIPTIEVHISAVEEREDFRQISYVGKIAKHTITGQGLNGYVMAMDKLLEILG